MTRKLQLLTEKENSIYIIMMSLLFKHLHLYEGREKQNKILNYVINLCIRMNFKIILLY